MVSVCSKDAKARGDDDLLNVVCDDRIDEQIFFATKKITCVGHGYDMREFFNATHHTPGAGVGYYIWTTTTKMETMALSSLSHWI